MQQFWGKTKHPSYSLIAKFHCVVDCSKCSRYFREPPGSLSLVIGSQCLNNICNFVWYRKNGSDSRHQDDLDTEYLLRYILCYNAINWLCRNSENVDPNAGHNEYISPDPTLCIHANNSQFYPALSVRSNYVPLQSDVDCFRWTSILQFWQEIGEGHPRKKRGERVFTIQHS